MPDIFITPNPHLPQPPPARRHSPQNNVRFQHQEPDEEILLFLRSHFITNLPWFFITLVALIVPLFLAPFVSNFGFTLPYRFTAIMLLFYYLIVFSYAFIHLLSWYYNVFIVTQKRIVDIDFSDLVYHNVAVTKLSQVEDVDYTQTGFIRSFFNYGDVFCQTAGSKVNFDALGVPKPAHVTSVIQGFIGTKHHGA